MTGLDWIIVGFAAILACFGFRRGFIVGVLSFGGFAIGAFLGTRLAPLLLNEGSSSPYAPALGLIGALLAGAILATGMEGVGFRLRRALILPGIGALDGLLGALLGAALALGVVWIVAAVVAQAPFKASCARTSRARRSCVSSTCCCRHRARSSTRSRGWTRCRRSPGLSPDVPAPPPRIARDPGVTAASASVVRVLGTACGLAIEGSGWVGAPDLIVTNAHVVAGESDTTVQVRGRSPSLPARPVAFDPRDDVAVLSVPGLGLSPLRLPPDPPSGRAGAILGYPENGPFDCNRPASGARRPCSPTTPTAAGPFVACSRLCVGWCVRATPAARSSAATAAC